MPISAIKIPKAVPFEIRALACLCVLGMLCAAAWLLPEPGQRGWVQYPLRAFRVIHRRQLSRDELEQMTAGYYDGIFRHGEEATRSSNLISGQWQWSWNKWKPLNHIYPIHHIRGDFLYYELKPNLNVSEFGVKLITNSRGMADKEYALQAAPGTRRIALIGDSLTRGLGAPFGKCYEALLEEELNQNFTSDRVQRYEVLNFAVGGYRIEQLYEVAQVKVAPFHPDVYAVALTQLVTISRYGDHICQLLQEGVDLKYPYLNELVRKAGIRPDDSLASLDAKLAPYAIECASWFVREIRDFAHAQGAEVIVFMIPPVIEADLAVENCHELVEEVQKLDIEVVNLLETFRDVEPDRYRIAKMNVHANELGHDLLFQQLMKTCRQQPRAWQILTGLPPTD